jgi:Tol biopolymer transport system component/C-terminal processing protease CtpA/Prc
MLKTALARLRNCLLLSLISVFTFGQTSQDSSPSFAEPSISPDRSEIAFISGGDIWTVPANGGEARLLVSHPANESRPIYSPDGRKLAFVSSRTGNGDIYVLSLSSGELKRLTFDDANELLDGWSHDGRWIYFSSTSRDISGMNDIYRVSADGGTPMQVSADRYTNEFYSAPSPDGQSLAFAARGRASADWWRKGHSHIDESEIWLLRNGNGQQQYERVSEGGAKEVWPMWAADGRGLFYISDRSGAQNIWQKPLGGAAKQITRFKDGRIVWPSISYDGKTIVFERNFKIWKLETANGVAVGVPITRRGAPASPTVERLRLTDQFRELALSPDGRKIAFVARGEIFAASSKDGGDAARVTTTVANEYQIAWAPDSRRIVYVSERDGTPHLYLYDFGNKVETQLTRDTRPDDTPVFSPDGKLLAFQREGKELRVFDLESKQDRVLASGYFSRPPLAPDRPFVWSPDGKWIAFMGVSSTKGFRNVQIVATSGTGGGEARQVSFLANSFGGALSWSPDGTYLLFNTSQRTEQGQIARVDLIPRTPKFREDQFRDLFKEEVPRNRPAEQTRPQQNDQPAAAPSTPTTAAQTADPRRPAPKPVEINFDNIRQRLSLVPTGVDVNSLAVSPDGKVLLMTASAAGQVNLYTYSLDELAREPAVARQLTSTPGFKSEAQFSPDGREVYYLENGRISVITVDTRVPRPVAVTAELSVDFAKERREVFRQAWTVMRDFFYDPNYHGANWDAVRREYEPLVAGAGTPDEMRRLLNLMVGELNASHLGVSGAASGAPQPVQVGKLGLRFDRTEYENNGRLKITEVIALSPAAVAASIKVGEYLLAVDGAEVKAGTNLDELLEGKTNRRVELTIAGSASGDNKRDIAVRPIVTGAEKNLLYRQWVEEQRTYVARVSNGRLGYVHMPDMGQGSLNQLHVDLDTENHAREGVVVDIRNNNGGFVNVYAIDVLARRGYLTMTVRGMPSAPARQQLGQRALEAPTILITNQHSLSDAEDFAEGYRTLKLGKVIGEPTAGWIIYTSGTTLIDGSNIRIPFIKITANDGTNMELNPRPVDIPVTRPIGETYTGRDSQLDTAVKELLRQIDEAKKTRTASGN